MPDAFDCFKEVLELESGHAAALEQLERIQKHLASERQVCHVGRLPNSQLYHLAFSNATIFGSTVIRFECFLLKLSAFIGIASLQCQSKIRNWSHNELPESPNQFLRNM